MSGAGAAQPRILLVDDNEANLRLLARILVAAGFSEFTEAADVDAALACFDQAEPDIALVDLHMPGRDGFELLESIQERTDDDTFLPIVVLTADTDPESRDRALAAGAHDFLTKPYDHSEVILRVRNLLHARALHLRLRDDNRQLEARLVEHEQRARRLAAEARDRRRHIEALMADGILTMVFQPIVDLGSGTVTGLEALARFDTEPARSPDVWFAEAAAVGLGVELEAAAVEEAVRHLGRLPDAAFLSVNVSPEVVRFGQLADRLEGVATERLVLELTEHEVVDDYMALGASLDHLREMGLRLAVDDTGSGFASLQHILRLDPDIIKLDLGLTRGIDTDPARRALGKALVLFGEEIGATIIAEGVETEAELATLRSLGTQCAQGYHLGRPAPLP